ncbi:TPA: hypothetical protein DD449_04895 [Candidatus Berkelbacteria bacterium]|uniref:Uncharacterized protein n=1 Tax=Berkelbacteria bacterium GW2011_GWE1_39_12 TaxID=1618337 RepID=A0A0G4B3H7_9BACT|nr:MAG: hypothetical protein UT28_C0001G0598 [Berkelbacteria bacterium GW2011_GWE1_39_12]HBO60990.1 hypothetical protein [Candidatus Berkelbacteria bacterium]
MEIIKLDGANIDIDLTSNDKTSWKQAQCPWNKAEGANLHRCAVKNTSICSYFCGIEYEDTVMCCYPDKNISVDKEKQKI